MGDFSADPARLLADSRGKDYFGIHVEQGVPVLDRDLNLLHDLILSAVQNILARYVGDGSPASGGGFQIQAIPAANDFLVTSDAGPPATCVVGGVEVTLRAPRRYTEQQGLTALSTPAADRLDQVYLDVWVTEVDDATDRSLRNEQDVGARTAVRLQATWAVRVAEGGPVPPPPAGHAFHPLARLARTAGKAQIEAAMITDLRRRRLNVADLESRLTTLEVALLLPAFSADEFTPRLGKPHDPVTITGANLDTPGTTVTFGDHPAEAITGHSPTTLVAKVPTGIVDPGQTRKVNITVTTDHGSITSTNQFTVSL